MDYGFVKEIAPESGYTPHIQTQDQEKQESKKARRRVVERTPTAGSIDSEDCLCAGRRSKPTILPSYDWLLS